MMRFARRSKLLSMLPLFVLANLVMSEMPAALAQQADTSDDSQAKSSNNEQSGARRPVPAKPKREPKTTSKEAEVKALTKVPPANRVEPVINPNPTPAAAPPTAVTGPSHTLAEIAGDGVASTALADQLRKSGAGFCADKIDSAAAPAMVGVVQSNTVSTWSNVPPRDKHPVSVFIGQRYKPNGVVPFGATGVLASPNPSGSCDVTVVQVVASPRPCANVRTSMMAKGKEIGDLAGVTWIKAGEEQTLLMPTGTNTCVLIGFKSTFAP